MARPPLLIKGMHGLGDNLHQRAIVRQYMATHDVWLESSWVAPYYDFVAAGLKIIFKRTALRTQTKNANREAALFSHAPVPRNTRTVSVSYRPQDVIARGSVLAAMCATAGCHPANADFRLPVPPAWRGEAARYIDQWNTGGKPIMLYRPLVQRTEWTGNATRNPDHDVYAQLLAAVRDRFFVVSVADLEAGREWIVGKPASVDAAYHSGELPFEVLAALTERAALVFTSPGFGVVLAQAVGTPVACIFGGYENATSFSAGACFAPYLGIEPIRPCSCWSHHHACDKRVNIPAAIERLKGFIDATAASPAIVA